MKKRDFKMISVLLWSTLLISCANQSPKDPVSPALTPITTPIPSPVSTPTSAVAPEPTMPENLPEILSPTPEFTPTPIPEPTLIPEPNLACMYVNYANSFPIVVTDNYSVEFHYDDTVTATNSNGYSYKFSLSEFIFQEEIDLSDPDYWYFRGAFQSDNIVYAHFDYLTDAQMTPSLLIKIELHETDADVSCCVLSHNPQKHFQDSFTVTKNYIYYTNTYYDSNGTATTDILRTDKNGDNGIVFYAGILGETIPYMTCDGNYLTYTIMDSNEAYRLASIDLSTGEEKLLSKQLSQPDFLIAWNGYVFTSVQNSRLTYYDCTIAKQKSIVYTTNSSISAGYPLTDGENLYLPLISYSGSIATTLLPLDMIDESVMAEIILDDTYYYCIGMIDEYLYAENIDSLIVFNIAEQTIEQD